MPRAFITGITGQDGQHLAEFLHGKGYEVFGMVKGQNNPRMSMMRDEFPYVEPVPGDLADLPSLVKALDLVQPDEVYNLAAISFVAMSFNQAELTANITGTGVLRMLDAIRIVGGSQDNPMRFYQASSSEMFGKVRETPQTELTPFHPRSPYGCAKVFGHDITVNYRESYGLFACSGILFNHEGPRRGMEFVTRKVTNAAARINLGPPDHERRELPARGECRLRGPERGLLAQPHFGADAVHGGRRGRRRRAHQRLHQHRVPGTRRPGCLVVPRHAGR